MRILVTGGAGFIGSHLVEKLVADGHRVTVLDDFNDYYDPAIKEKNLSRVRASIRLHRGDIRDPEAVKRAFDESKPEAVVHLAARAGVRPSVENPVLYHDVNCLGTVRILEACRGHDVQRLVFGSSSSVYGNSPRVPFSEDDPAETPVSPYGATKRAGEEYCRVWNRLHGIPCVCLRFFNAYGPRQRPDMAIPKFSKMILAGEPIPIYGDGTTTRDWTYVGDIVEGILAAIDRPIEFDIVNLGGGHAVPLNQLVHKLGVFLGRPVKTAPQPPQPGDLPRTLADTRKVERVLGFHPKTAFDDGLKRYVDWYKATR